MAGGEPQASPWSVPIVAAALKSEQLWETSPQPFASPTFALIVFEFAFAAWLLAGWLPRLTWWLAGTCFAVLGAVAATKLLSGDADCGCFGGAVPLSPVVAFSIDMTAVAALIACRKSIAVPRTERPRVDFVLTVMAAATAVGLALFAGIAEVLARRADAVAAQWTPGTRLSLLSHIDIGGELVAGEWALLLVRPGCHRCEVLCGRLAEEHLGGLPDEPGSVVVLFVVPPTAYSRSACEAFPRHARFTGSHDLPIATPLLVRISNGLIVDVVQPHLMGAAT